jgi:hypothetical protein
MRGLRLATERLCLISRILREAKKGQISQGGAAICPKKPGELSPLVNIRLIHIKGFQKSKKNPLK